MAVNIESKDDSTTNPCCKTWEDKYLKLQQKVKKVEDGRAALKKAVGIYEQQFDRMQNENLKLNKAYEEEKLQTDHERKEKEKESAAREKMENEISTLKAEILSLSQNRGLISGNMSQELVFFKQRVSDKEKEITCLQEEKKRAMADKSRLEQELSNFKTQLVNLETEKKRVIQELQKERKRGDEMSKTVKTKLADAEVNDLETEIGRLKEVVENERKRADFEAKKAETEKKTAHKVKEMLKTELLKAEKIKKAEVEINDLETEIVRLKEVVENERKRADFEAKKAETEKKTVYKVKEMLKAEQSRADEQRKLVEVERKKNEEFAHQLEKSKCEVDETKSKLVSEGLKLKEANKKFEAEKKRSIKEKKKAEEQQKIAEMSSKHASEEKQNAARLQQELNECRKMYDKLKKEMEIYETNKKKTNLDMDKEIEKDSKKRINRINSELVFSKNSSDAVNVSFAEMKLLKRKLKFEKERVKHFEQVAKLERKCKKTVEEELNRLKLEFALFSSRVGLCGCFDLEKNENKRQRLQAGNELEKIPNPSDYLKPKFDTSSPSLLVSGTCTESTAGTASKTDPLCNRKKLDRFALVSSRSSFSNRNLPLPLPSPMPMPASRLSSPNADVADINIKSPLKSKKRKRVHNENEEVENFKKKFDGDCMKLLDFDSEVEEARYRAAVERPVSPTLPKIQFESGLILLEDSRPSESESWSIVVFLEIRNTESVSKIFRIIKSYSRQCCEISHCDIAVKNIISTLSGDKILSPKEKVCVLFSLFLKSFSTVALTNFDHASVLAVSGQLKKVMCDMETRLGFEKVIEFEELIALIQTFLVNGEILICTETCSELSSLPVSKPSSHELVAGAVFLASVCEAFDRVDFLCETSYAISRVTDSLTLTLTLTLLHVFVYVCGEKLLSHGDYSLIMTVVKSLVTYHERANLSLSGFSACARCPFSIGAVSMEELALLLLKRLNECLIHKSLAVDDDALSDLGDVMSLLELLATKMSWDWVCKNIVNDLLKISETCVMGTPLTSVFVLLGQMARRGIDANGFQDAEVEGIRVKLISFISETASRQISFPVQFAAVTALLGTTPLGFNDICKNRIDIELPPPVNPATDCLRRWFSSLSDESKSLSVRHLTAEAL